MRNMKIPISNSILLPVIMPVIRPLCLPGMHGAKVLLGTATPSVETYYNCKTGKYKLVELNERYLNLELPEITVVNTRELRRRKQMQSHFSPVLLDRYR